MGFSGSNALTHWRPYWLRWAPFVIVALVVFAPGSALAQTPSHSGKKAAQAPPASQTADNNNVNKLAETEHPPATLEPKESAQTQLARDCANLFKLAKELKVEMDKTDSNSTLSLDVLRKAANIRTLAHKIRQEMKPLAEK